MTFAVSLDIGGSLAKCVMYSVTDGTECKQPFEHIIIE